MKIHALLTGRGNNTLKDKNVLDILGKPVLYYSAHEARKVDLIDDWYCSSDDEKILSAAEAEGYKRIVRPAELATPTSPHIECILHALHVMEEQDNMPDICVVLLANNVTVKSKWIADCVAMMLEDDSITAVVPVYKDNDHHPLRAKVINGKGQLEMYENKPGTQISTNRQQLPPCYFLCHNFWVLRVPYLLSGKQGQPPWSFMGDNILPYEVGTSIDIHDITDLYIAQAWIEKNLSD